MELSSVSIQKGSEINRLQFKNISSKDDKNELGVKLNEYQKDVERMAEECDHQNKVLKYTIELYSNAGKVDSIQKFNGSFEKSERSASIGSPEIFLSPRKDDDRFTDVESIYGIEQIEDEDEDKKSRRAYTARSFNIQYEKCFDVEDDENHSQELFQPTGLTENTINKPVIENENFTMNLLTRKPFDHFCSPSDSDEFGIISTAPKIFPDTSSSILRKSHVKVMKSHFIAPKNVKYSKKRQEAALNREIRSSTRKARLRRTNSRSTTTSRLTTNLPDFKNPRKKKRRGKRTIGVRKSECERKNPHPLEKKSLASSNEKLNKTEREERTEESQTEIVELFNNFTAKNAQNISVTSSHRQFTFDIEASVPLNEEKVVKSPTVMKPARKSPTKIPKRDEKLHNPAKPVATTIELDHNIPIRKEKKANEENPKHCREDPHQSTPIRSWYCEPFVPPTYQQPTIASKLKRNNRCYFTTRFNFRSIPFVVGTSVTRSHNLGLNIQQVLSLIKTRQPSLVTDVRPALIKKIGRGLNPAYNLLESLDDTSIKSEDKMKGRNLDDSFSSSKSERNNNIEENLITTQKEELRREKEFRTTAPGSTHQTYRIKNVMIQLHDELEEMNSRYVEIREQAKKTPDEKLQAEMNELEAEMSVKEDEIHAVVGLYKEITARTTKRGKKIPSTSTRLTGLLRQIQSFQQHLITS